MKILVPTDFSDNAKNALDFAKNIARQQNSKITLFFAFYAVYDFAAQATEIIAQIEQDAKKAMKECVDSGTSEGFEIDYKIEHGPVSTAVTTYAYREGYDLIVMGTQGASGIRKALVGSNTGHVIKDSQVPVLAVPGQALWENIHKISVGVELEKEEERFYIKLSKLTAPFKLPYVFFHLQNRVSFEKEILFKGLLDFFRANCPEAVVMTESITADNVYHGIDLYIKNKPDSILVMFYKKKTFFEYLFNKSTSVQIAYHTHVPLLVLK